MSASAVVNNAINGGHAVGYPNSTHTSCPICFEDYTKNELTNPAKVLELSCHHCFHPECLKSWIAEKEDAHSNLTCGACRTMYATPSNGNLHIFEKEEDCNHVFDNIEALYAYDDVAQNAFKHTRKMRQEIANALVHFTHEDLNDSARTALVKSTITKLVKSHREISKKLQKQVILSIYATVSNNGSLRSLSEEAERWKDTPFEDFPEHIKTVAGGVLVFSAIGRIRISAEYLYKIRSILPDKMPQLKKFAFQSRHWIRYCGDVGNSNTLAIPQQLLQMFHNPCPFTPNQKISNTHIAVLMPPQLNGKDFSLTVLLELMKNPKKPGTTQFAYCTDTIRKRIGHLRIKKAYWALVFKGIIPQSQNMTYEDQQALFQEGRIAYGYEPPTTLEATTSAVMHSFQTDDFIYEENPWVYTRCKETVPVAPLNRKQCSVIVSGFGRPGLDSSAGGLIIDEDRYGNDCGIGAVKKFF